MKILFISLSGIHFDTNTPYRQPLGGTESAIAYLAVELAKRGHDVTLISNTEQQIIGAVKHVPLSDDPAILLRIDPDFVIVASAPSAFPGLTKILPRAKLILWNHMRPDEPAVQDLFNREVQRAIPESQIVYVSKAQRDAYIRRNPNRDSYLANEHGTIIGNAISTPFENMFSGPEQLLQVKQCTGAYTSTPYRGLAGLAAIKEIPIDVYSSMQVYQGSDDPYKPMYENLAKNPYLRLHGSVAQPVLRERLRPASFLVYPCIFPECHSIAILEAMAAGLQVITTAVAMEPNGVCAILPSTTATIEGFIELLRKQIEYFRSRRASWVAAIWAQVQTVNQQFTWKRRAEEWEKYFRSL